MLFHQIFFGNQDDPFHVSVFGRKLFKMQAAKALHTQEIPGSNGISLKIRKDRQGPHAGGIASLWKNGGTHVLDRACGNTGPKSANKWRDITK
jgi:hypothetical protein